MRRRAVRLGLSRRIARPERRRIQRVEKLSTQVDGLAERQLPVSVGAEVMRPGDRDVACARRVSTSGVSESAVSRVSGFSRQSWNSPEACSDRMLLPDAKAGVGHRAASSGRADSASCACATLSSDEALSRTSTSKLCGGSVAKRLSRQSRSHRVVLKLTMRMESVGRVLGIARGPEEKRAGIGHWAFGIRAACFSGLLRVAQRRYDRGAQCLKTPSWSVSPACFWCPGGLDHRHAAGRRLGGRPRAGSRGGTRRVDRRSAGAAAARRVARLGVEGHRAAEPIRRRHAHRSRQHAYFDAGRFPEAVGWYQQALKINPKDVNVSTDLGIAYYYMNDPDIGAGAVRPVARRSDPSHVKTLLNIGIVRAFGKQDLKGAAEVWQKILVVAPSSDEARAANAGARRHPVGASRAGDREGGVAVIRLDRARASSRWSCAASFDLSAGVAEGCQGPPAPRPPKAVPLVRDPVCGIYVVPSTALSSGAGSQTKFFCSENCRRTYGMKIAQ